MLGGDLVLAAGVTISLVFNSFIPMPRGTRWTILTEDEIKSKYPAQYQAAMMQINETKAMDKYLKEQAAGLYDLHLEWADKKSPKTGE